MEGIHDKSEIEKSPQVLEYEKRNKIKHEGYRRDVQERNVHVPSHTSDVSTIGEAVTAKRMLTAHIHSRSLNKIQVLTLLLLTIDIITISLNLPFICFAINH
jgi:hypothetical protein